MYFDEDSKKKDELWNLKRILENCKINLVLLSF